jgi:hypothetical protein
MQVILEVVVLECFFLKHSQGILGVKFHYLCSYPYIANNK